jgi:hypothetical protein
MSAPSRNGAAHGKAGEGPRPSAEIAACLEALDLARARLIEARREWHDASHRLEAVLLELPGRVGPAQLKAAIQQVFREYPEINRRVLSRALYGHEDCPRLLEELGRGSGVCAHCGEYFRFDLRRAGRSEGSPDPEFCRECVARAVEATR